MPLLNTVKSSKSKDLKFVGGYIPLQINTYLTLYCLVYLDKKSKVMQYALENWKTQLEAEEPLIELIQKVRTRIEETYMSSTTKNFQNFKIKIKKELCKKGIDSSIVESILKEVHNGKNG